MIDWLIHLEITNAQARFGFCESLVPIRYDPYLLVLKPALSAIQGWVHVHGIFARYVAQHVSFATAPDSFLSYSVSTVGRAWSWDQGL